MPEWRKIFEAEDSDLPELGAMEVCSSTEMDAPGASHLGTGGHGPKTDRSKPRSVPETLGPYRDCPGATRFSCGRNFCRDSFDRVV
jgi:hypothetical protein